MRSWIACLALLFQVVSVAQAQQTIRVSVASDGTEGNGGSEGPALSPNCRFVAFHSTASNLVEGDTNGKVDVFVRDRWLGETTRVSIASNGAQGNSDSSYPALSDDGRLVAFSSASDNLVPLDTNGERDVFVHDRTTGETTRVSVASDGSQAVGGWSRPDLDISADGQIVAFHSSASNLVPLDTNGKADIFVHDRTTGETTRVSVASDGAQANGGSTFPALSADGRLVAFSSHASNLVPLDTNAWEDIFVHDRLTGQTTRVNVASDGSQAVGRRSFAPDINHDGRFVAFVSDAQNLAPNDGYDGADSFVHDRQTGETILVSVDSLGVGGNDWSYNVWISANGRVVVFISAADNLVSDDTNLVEDVFAHDWWTGKTVRVSLADNGDEANDLSLRLKAAICSNGRAFGFSSVASNLVQGDLNASPDVFIRDFGLFADSFESGDTSAWSDSVP